MKRRSFITNIGRSSISLPLALSFSGQKKFLNPDYFSDFELEEKTISQIRALVDQHGAEHIVNLYLDRIKRFDQIPGGTNAVIEINPDAINIAKELDAQTKKGPLHGIPILLKDNIDASGNMMTTAGSLALQGHYAKKDAFIVAQLKKAGAVILGKTNLSEWANFRSTRSASGWSSRGGQTRNPYILDRNPCGSSSGSGVAASANYCAAAIGTETNGSIVCPSSVNGIVGIKPTIGLLSRSGIIPIAHSHDTAGPMTRTVMDAALLLTAMAGYDPNDPGSIQHPSIDYVEGLSKNALKGKRLGINKSATGFHSGVDKLFAQAVKTMEKAGATVIELDDVVADGAGRGAFDVLLYEFKHGLNQYLYRLAPGLPVHSLSDLIEYNKKNSDKILPYFDQEILELANAKGGLDEEAYKDAIESTLTKNGPEGIDRTMQKHSLDAIIAPTAPPSWSIDVVNGDHYLGGSSSPAARAGYPNITVPMGFIHGLPVGLSIFSGAFKEMSILNIAYAFEQLTSVRIPPGFKRSLNL